MDPIGASRDWQWHGYRNAYLEPVGKTVPRVSGGGHRGGCRWRSGKILAVD